MHAYSSPVDQLLAYGKAEVVEAKDWPDYRALGLGSEHIPELIRMATDEELNTADSESLEVWAPTHAWRALGQLHAQAAIEPLLSLFKLQEDSEWVMEELPEVYGMFGPAAFPALTAFVADEANGEWPRISAISSIEKIGVYTPEARSRSIEILSKQLETLLEKESFEESDYEVCSFLVLSLVHLQAKEAAPLIERAFAENRVETMIMGEWEDVQETLGLLSPEEVEKLRQRREEERQARIAAFDRAMEISSRREMGDFSPEESYTRVAAHKKAKRKQKLAKQARKKNRKR
jgi:hypothetical protein